MKKISKEIGAIIARSFYKIFIVIIIVSISLCTVKTDFFINFADMSEIKNNYQSIIGQINITRIWQHMYYLSSFDSRVSGYPGCELAAVYIQKTFESYGLKVQNQYFNVTVPVDLGSFIVLPNNKTIKAYSLWPNLIQPCRTPPEGIEGHLIYVGRGDLTDFDYKKVEGSIAVFDFDSGKNWLNAAKMGAKAAIFLEGNVMNSFEAYQKMSLTPINFPRLYVPIENYALLRKMAENQTVVRVVSNMMWQSRTVRNVIGILEGKTLKDEIIIISAYYDAWSVTPSLAPGADETAGIASLLELANLLSKEPQERTIWFVALTGHWQFLLGAREFVEEYYFNQRKNILFMIGLDFSTESNTLGLMYASHAYGYGGAVNLPRYIRWIFPEIWDRILPEMERILQKPLKNVVIYNGIIESGWNTLIPVPYYLDSEALSLANGLSISLCTTKTFRYHSHHPKSTIEKVNLQNLIPQLEVSYGIIYGLVSLKEVRISLSEIEPQRSFVRLGLGSGFLTIKGKVRTYNATTMWYSDITGEYGQILIHIVPTGTIYDFFKHIVILANSDGSFEVHGIASVAAYGGHGAMWSALYRQILVEAFVIDPITSNILYAPDYGPYGGGSFPQIIIADHHPMEVFPTVFRASTVILFDIVDPRNLSPLGYIDPATRTVSGATPWQILAYESYTWENFLFSSTIMVPDEQTMTLFIPLNARFVAVLKCGLENLVSGVLTNSSLENPEGVGYLVTESEFRLTYTALHIVRDLYNLLKSRSAILSTFRINDPLINLTRSKIESVLPKIYNSLENARFSEAYSLIYSAWNWEVQCYFQVARVINDVNMSAFFFFALLVPFSIIVEKAILHATDKNRIIGVIGIFTLMTMIFCFFHPGAHLSGNAPVVITGVIMIVSAIIILTAFSQETLNVLKKIRTKILGFHFVERGQLSFYFTSLSIGIENLRRRRLRTLLTLITLILLTFALTSFTTIFPTLFPKESEVPEIKPSYQGILIRRAQGEPGRDLGKLLMEHIKAMVKEGAVVAPRYYYYPPLLTFFGQCEITGFNSTYAILAVLGLSPEEKDVTGVNELLEAGRWFISSDHYACIITDKVAKGLLVSPGDTIIFQGIKLTVVGIVNSALSNLLIDLDGRLYTPLDPRYLVGLTPQSLALTEFSEQYIPLTWDEILIVPSSLAESLGAYLSSIAIRIDDEVLIKKISQELSMMMYGFDIWFSHNNRIFVIRRSAVYEMGGLWAYLIPIIIISMLTALLTMLGSVHERMREIGIFSSLGLSPKQVAVLFFAESAFFAVVSGIVGYLMSVGAVYIIYALDIFQHGLYSNYAATYVIILLSLLMSVTLLSTLYPALKASKLVTPSLERKWRVLTKPTGVEWEIPLPFYAVSKEEAIGLLRYISEYFEAQMLESGAEIFITRSIEFKPEEEKVFARVALAPFEMGVVQEVTLRTFISPDSGKYSFALRLKRVSGLHEVWLTRVRNFVDEVRKQFLIWGSLSREEKNKYIARELKSKSLTKNY